MDFDLGSYISQVFQGMRGAFAHTEEERSRDFGQVLRDGLRGPAQQPLPEGQARISDKIDGSQGTLLEPTEEQLGLRRTIDRTGNSFVRG